MELFMISKSIDHLGLVAGMIDELKIVEVIDRNIEQDLTQRKVSIGECVKAMILNGLGFVNSQLYLVSYFLGNMPLDKLFNKDIDASYFNDDTLGRALDSIYSNDVCQLFSFISATTCNVLKLKDVAFHIDSTSFHTHGEHENTDIFDTKVIELVKGYSRDHRPELNQAVLGMIVSNKSSIPLAMKPLSGNSSDNKEFPKLIRKFIKNLQNEKLEPVTFIADSALYSHENISSLPKDLLFITRVPERIKELKEHYKKLDANELTEIDSDYSFKEYESHYAGVKQRWIVFLSKPSQAKKLKTYEKNLQKKIDSEKAKIQDICKKEFVCKEDAKRDFERVYSKCNYIVCNKITFEEISKYKNKGRPGKSSEVSISYKITSDIEINNELIETEKSRIGLFTLSTNHLEKYSASEILKLYKDQGKVERGFRFLKDNTFMASSIYLEKPQRIEALMFVMCLCLMVYSALEYKIRKELKDRNLTFRNQVKKEVQNPTCKWVFCNFIGIHVIYDGFKTIVLNKMPKHNRIIKILGENYIRHYL